MKTLISRFALVLLTATLFVLTSCLEKEEVPPTGDYYPSFENFFAQNGVKAREFNLDPTVPNTIEGPQGTRITFPADAFVDTDGNPVSGNILVTLRDFFSQKDLVLSGMNTNNNANMLVSGGSFELRATQLGEALQVSPFKNVQARLPIQTQAQGFENQMMLFVGEENPATGGGFNWQMGREQMVQQDSTGGTRDYLMNDIQMGYTNCDALYSIATEDRTQFRVSVNGASPNHAQVLLLVKDLTSVINVATRVDDYFVTYVESVPLGLEGTLVAIAMEDGQLRFGELPITVLGNDDFQVDLNPGTTEALKALLADPF